MKFRRRSSKARVSGRSFFRARRSSKRSSGRSGLSGDAGLIGGAMVYGAGREWLSSKLQPVTQPVAGALGNYADEAVLGALGYFMMKGKIPLVNKLGFTRDIGRAMVTIEAARIGQGVIGQVMPSATVSASNNW